MTYDEFLNFLDQFEEIKSFAGRIRFADQHLQRIGSGSGRIVYDIDGNKVFKIAKNTKGVAQNDAESDAGRYEDTHNIVTKIFEFDNNGSWIIAEKGKKVTENRIKELTGIPSLDKLHSFLKIVIRNQKPGRNIFGHHLTDEEKEFFWENELASDLADFAVNYGQEVGDMGRPSTYGEVLRDGQPTIVLTDYGLSDEVYSTHYDRSRKQKYQMYELFDFAHGNTDVLIDAGDTQDILNGMWALIPHGVGDGDGVVSEEFINFISNRDKYPKQPISKTPYLVDGFHDCVNNLKEVLNRVDDKKKFYQNLVKLQEYLIEQNRYDRDPIGIEEYSINENEQPNVVPFTLEDEQYSQELADAVSQKLGLPKPVHMGGGGYGFAYELDAERVLKLTSDISEADSASKLMRGHPKYLAEPYEIYKVVDTEKNVAYFAIIQENINDKPVQDFIKYGNDIDKIEPNGMNFGDIMISIKNPRKFNYEEVFEIVKKILTDNPNAGVSQTERENAYKYMTGILNIRQELINYDIKSTDYITTKNLGYKDGVLKYFDIGGYKADEPNVGNNVVYIPENQEIISEDYDVDIANKVAARIGELRGFTPKVIRGGMFGVAYDIGDNKVLKITKDKSEAMENLRLIGKPLKYIAEPYEVFSITPKAGTQMPETYAIILEKLRTDTDRFQRSKQRMDFAFDKIMNVRFSDVIDAYVYDEWYDERLDKEKIEKYMSRNPEDKWYFEGILKIAEEVKKYGVESMDYLNYENLGYTKDGNLGFFDVGFGNYYQTSEKNPEVVQMQEDGSSKFSTDSDLGQDGFPAYNQNDTSPSIENNVGANSAMYNEDRKKSYMPGAQSVEVKKKCRLGGLGNTSVACNQGDISNLELTQIKENVNTEKYYRAVEKNMGKTVEFEPEGFYEAIDDDGNPIWKYDTFWVSETPEVAASKSVGGAVMGLYSMFMQHGKNPQVFYIYEINEKPDVDISHWDMGDFAHLKEVRYRRPVQGTYKGKVTITDDLKQRLRAFYEITGLDAYDEPDEEYADIFQDTDYDGLLGGIKNLVNEEVKINIPGKLSGYNSFQITNDGRVVGSVGIVDRGIQGNNHYIAIDKIIIDKNFRGKGYANAAMNIILEYADNNNLIITLTPDNVWGASVVKLKAWYSSLGFVMNKGKNKDFQTMQLMYRLPKSAKLNEETYSGKGYRVNSNYTNSRGTTAGDVVRFERDELGNVGDFEHLTDEMLKELDKYDARDIVWVTKTFEDAKRYSEEPDFSDIEEFDIGGEVIGEDGDGGYLILTKQWSNSMLSEEIDASEAYTDQGALKTLLSGKRDVAFIEVNKDNAHKIQKHGLQILPVRMATRSSMMCVVFRDKVKGERLYAIAKSHGGYLSDKTPEEAREIGRLLGYREATIDEYVRRKYGSKVPVIPEKSPEDYDDLYEGQILSLEQLPFKKDVEERGGKIFSVGGAVRDEFLGKESKDLDVLITGIPMDELEQLLSKYGRVDAVGKSFGVLKFRPQGGEEIDIAIPRTEKPSGEGGHKGFDVTSDHALPIEKDLERRDFTINAIAKDVDGNIVDPFGGQQDLQNKIIRIVNPEAFSDDPLRMLRAVQFASRFGFTIEPETMNMIRENAERIKEIPTERILTEFDKIVKKGNMLTGAQLLKDTGLFQQIFGFDIKQSTIDRSPFDDVKTMGEFIYLLTRLLPNPAEYYKNNLKGEIDTHKEIKALDMAFDGAESTNSIEARSIAHNMYVTSPQSLQSGILPTVIEKAAQELLTGKYPKTVNELAINGNDLMQLGLRGKEIGDMQKSLLLKIYANKIRNDKKELLNLTAGNNSNLNEYRELHQTHRHTWRVNGQEVGVEFFVKQYDKWNNQNGRRAYGDPTRASVLEFLQNNYEDLSTDNILNRELYWKLIDREVLNEDN